MEPKIDFISRFTFILFGIFITSVIFALAMKSFGEIGIYLSLLLCSGLSAFGFIYFKHSPRLRLILYGMISMLIIAVLLLIVGLGVLSGMFKTT